jgi:hypothetical protein
VQAGQLTIVGGVYDFRNDLQQGAGKLVIVNVNGNSEPARMTAFVDAIASVQNRDAKDGDKKAGKSKKFQERRQTGRRGVDSGSRFGALRLLGAQ